MSDYFDGCTTPAEVKERWRALARRHHPDRGGDAATFHRVKAAYDMAMVEVTRPIVCEHCHGQGRVQQRHGFNVATLRCAACHGKGRTYRGDDT